MTSASAPHRALGLDFGTTNSALAAVGHDAQPRLARFHLAPWRKRPATTTTTFRSVLYFDEDEPDARGQPAAIAGPEAIERYLDRGCGRFIQSTKSYLASSLFKATQVHGRTLELEALIAMILRPLRQRARADLGALAPLLVVGRPVRYAHARDPRDEAMALERMRRALALAGFDETEVRFEYEPLAAAWRYEQRLDHDELVLIADFGGGTSDFTLAQVGPSRRSRSDAVLGSEGVALAGDAFDSEIVRHVIAPELGMGSAYRDLFTGQCMPVPSWIYSKLRRWHHLSFLRSDETLAALEKIRFQALEPERIETLIRVVEADLGFEMYRSVERTKVALSSAPTTRLRFDAELRVIEATLEAAQFEGWLGAHLLAITEAVERLLEAANIARSDVDRVFLTGGSSLVPAVRRIFAERFGEARLRGGEELTTVARGLALSGLRD